MRTIPLFILFLFALSGCEKDLTDKVIGNPASPRKILIAGTDSVFKQEVIRLLTSDLSADDVNITVTGLNRLSDVRAGDYKAVLILAPIQAGKVGKQAEEFIQAQRSGNRVILFYTRGSDGTNANWAKPDLGVDTVSSASRNERAGERAKQLAGLIQKKIGR